MKIFICLEKSKRALISILLAALLGGCAAADFSLPLPLPEPAAAAASGVTTQPEEEEELEFVRSQRLPALQIAQWEGEENARWQGLELPSGEFDLNVEGVPLSEFIHIALGDVLGLSYDMSQDVAEREDEVTLRISTPVSAQRLLGMVEQTIAAYDVGLAWQAGALHVLPASEMIELPPVPVGSLAGLSSQLGRVMTFLPMQYASPAEVMVFAQQYLNIGEEADVYVMPRLNALLIIGAPASIERFRVAVNMVDQPSMAGRHLQLIRTVYWSASEIEPILLDALRLQGLEVASSAGQPGVFISTIDQLNALLVAAPNESTIEWVEQWVDDLDTPEVVGESQRSFVYFVQHSTAEELGSTVGQVIGSIGDSVEQSDENATSSESDSSSASTNPGLRLVIDESHNSLVFVGSAQDYQMAYLLLQQLDIPAKQVLIEVTIADITLDQTQQLGIDWQFRDYNLDGSVNRTASTLGGVGVGASGLTVTAFDNDGLVRARLNALESSGDARILSSPKLLALDNEEASIQVGTQIAIITQEVGGINSGNDQENVLRSFTYLDTGIILNFVPTVMANGLVRLTVYQEVSSPGPSNNNTPPISKRSLETTLVAQSGQTVMLGGLITRNMTQQDTQVPILGDIPLAGSLFRSRQDVETSTEMIILITPHVIETPLQADELTNAFRTELGW
jgi:general secretion pathway protein D